MTLIERSPDVCRCGRPIEQVGSPVCGCDVAQAKDGHHRVFLCADVHCPGLRRGPCGFDPEDNYRWWPTTPES